MPPPPPPPPPPPRVMESRLPRAPSLVKRRSALMPAPGSETPRFGRRMSPASDVPNSTMLDHRGDGDAVCTTSTALQTPRERASATSATANTSQLHPPTSFLRRGSGRTIASAGSITPASRRRSGSGNSNQPPSIGRLRGRLGSGECASPNQPTTPSCIGEAAAGKPMRESTTDGLLPHHSEDGGHFGSPSRKKRPIEPQEPSPTAPSTESPTRSQRRVLSAQRATTQAATFTQAPCPSSPLQRSPEQSTASPSPQKESIVAALTAPCSPPESKRIKRPGPAPKTPLGQSRYEPAENGGLSASQRVRLSLSGYMTVASLTSGPRSREDSTRRTTAAGEFPDAGIPPIKLSGGNGNERKGPNSCPPVLQQADGSQSFRRSKLSRSNEIAKTLVPNINAVNCLMGYIRELQQSEAKLRSQLEKMRRQRQEEVSQSRLHLSSIETSVADAMADRERDRQIIEDQRRLIEQLYAEIERLQQLCVTSETITTPQATHSVGVTESSTGMQSTDNTETSENHSQSHHHTNVPGYTNGRFEGEQFSQATPEVDNRVSEVAKHESAGHQSPHSSEAAQRAVCYGAKNGGGRGGLDGCTSLEASPPVITTSPQLDHPADTNHLEPLSPVVSPHTLWNPTGSPTYPVLSNGCPPMFLVAPGETDVLAPHSTSDAMNSTDSEHVLKAVTPRDFSSEVSFTNGAHVPRPNVSHMEDPAPEELSNVAAHDIARPLIEDRSPPIPIQMINQLPPQVYAQSGDVLSQSTEPVKVFRPFKLAPCVAKRSDIPNVQGSHDVTSVLEAALVGFFNEFDRPKLRMAPVYAKRYVGREEKLFAELSKRYGSDCVSRLASRFNGMVAMRSGEEKRVRESVAEDSQLQSTSPMNVTLTPPSLDAQQTQPPSLSPEAVVSRCFPPSSSAKPFSMSAAAFEDTPGNDEAVKNAYSGEAFTAPGHPAPPKGSPSPRKRLADGLPPPHPAPSSLALKKQEQHHLLAPGSPRLRSRNGNNLGTRTPMPKPHLGKLCTAPSDEKNSPISSPTSMSSPSIKSPSSGSSKTSPRSAIVPVSLESLLRDFYRKHQPDKIQVVSTVASEYRGNERELIRLLRNKYGALSVKRLQESLSELERQSASHRSSSQRSVSKRITRTLLRFAGKLFVIVCTIFFFSIGGTLLLDYVECRDLQFKGEPEPTCTSFEQECTQFSVIRARDYISQIHPKACICNEWRQSLEAFNQKRTAMSGLDVMKVAFFSRTIVQPHIDDIETQLRELPWDEYREDYIDPFVETSKRVVTAGIKRGDALLEQVLIKFRDFSRIDGPQAQTDMIAGGDTRNHVLDEAPVKKLSTDSISARQEPDVMISTSSASGGDDIRPREPIRVFGDGKSMEQSDVMQVTVVQHDIEMVFESTEQGVKSEADQEEEQVNVAPELVQSEQPRSNGEDFSVTVEPRLDTPDELDSIPHGGEETGKTDSVTILEKTAVTADATSERARPGDDKPAILPSMKEDVAASVTMNVVSEIDRDDSVRFEKDDEMKPGEELDASTPISATDPMASIAESAAEVVSVERDSSPDSQVWDHPAANGTANQEPNESIPILADDEALRSDGDEAEVVDSNGFDVDADASALNVKDIAETEDVFIEEVHVIQIEIGAEYSSTTNKEDATDIIEEASLNSHTRADDHKSEAEESSDSKSTGESDVQFHDDDLDLQDLSDLDVDALLELADLAAAAELQSVPR